MDIDTGESAKVKFKIEIQNEHETGAAVQKQSYTPIMLQGSNHWKTVVLMDPDYNITKLNFDRFPEGFIPRLLFVRKKFSSEINKGHLQRLYKKRRMITDADVTQFELTKMLGNNLFKFFYSCLQEFSHGSHKLTHEDKVYLGLDHQQARLKPEIDFKAPSDKKETENLSYQFDCTELLEVFFGVLEENAPFFVHEYLQFLMIGHNGNLNPFHLLRDLFTKNTQGIDDIRLLTRYYSQVPKEGRSMIMKAFEANLYKLKTFLDRKLTFTDAEKQSFASLVGTTNNSRHKQRRLSDARRLKSKLRLNEVALPTLALKVISHCKALIEQLSTELRQDRSRLADVLAASSLIQDSGLGQFVKGLVDSN